MRTNYDKKHIAIQSCETIAGIMLPKLKPHGITGFNFYRIYFDGSVVRLSTDRDWTEHFFKNDYLSTMTIPESYLVKPTNYYIWLTEDCPEMLLDAAINFNSSNGISIAIKYEQYIEYYCYSTTRSNTRIINNFYLNNLDLLRQYGDDFKERAHALIEQAEKNKLIINPSVYQDACATITESFQPLNAISPQQLKCANYLLKGMQYKEIAREMKISPRTVETHLTHLKMKLNCADKAELLIKLSTFM